MKKLYCFDFDGTLTYRDTMFLFLKFYNRRKFYFSFVKHVPLFILLKLNLLEAEKAYKDGNYSLAKLKIDSIKELFPKDFDEINSGFQLMQEVRMAENKRNIAFCDSMLREHYSELNTMITKFDYVRDDRYQEFGEYFPKIYPNDSYN